MDAIDALGEFAKGIGVGQERPGHKYRSRKRVGNRWEYDYGEGGGPRQAKQEEPSKERSKAQVVAGAGRQGKQAEIPKAGPQAKQEPGKKPAAASSAGAAPRHWIASVAEVGLPKDTKEHYSKNGEYTPERKALHERLISKFFDHVPSVPETQKPVAVLMMGGTASGKSTLVRHAMGDAHDFVNVNSDDCKEQLPEYQRGISLGHRNGVAVSAKDAAGSVHEESSDIADALRDRTVKARKNMVLDGTGKNAEKFLATMKSLREAGYHVRVMMPHVKFEEAKKRAIDRANHTGRYVDEKVMEQNHHLVPGNFEKVSKEADDWALFDMGRPPPHIVWSGQGGKATIHDDSFVHEFQRVAQERHTRAKAQGWMKSAAERTLAKAMKADSKGSDLPPSVTLDDMIARTKVNRGEAPDTATDLEWEQKPAKGKPESKPEKKVEKSMDAIDALESFAKAGERSGHKYIRREADGRGGWRYFYKHPTKGTFAVPIDVERTTAGHAVSVGNVSAEHDQHVRAGIKHALNHANRSIAQEPPPAAPKSPHIFSEGHRHYGDTHLVSASQKHMPDMVLNHMGFGEFSLEGPRGRIDFNRMAGKDFPGQSGRSHLLEDDKGGVLVKELLDKEHAAHAAGIDVRSQTPENTEKSMDAIESLRLDAGGEALVPRHPSDLNSAAPARGPWSDAARSGTEAATVDADARRLEEMYQSLFGKKQEHPTSEKQMKWAWSAEERGELPKGTSKKWANRFYGKMTDAAFAAMIGKLCADDETRKSDDAIDALAPLVKGVAGAARAGHKYKSRKPNAHGGFDYEYEHPTHGTVRVETARSSEGHIGSAVMEQHGGTIGRGIGRHTNGEFHVGGHGGDSHTQGISEHAIHDTRGAHVKPPVRARDLPPSSAADVARERRRRGLEDTYNPTTGEHAANPTDHAGKPHAKKSESAYRLQGDTLRKGGLYQFDLSRTDMKGVAAVPENLLYDYLCSFVEEACEHESRERQHGPNELAGPVMHELVQYVIRNPNLMRAVKKFNVTAETLAEIIKAKGFAVPPTAPLSNDAASAAAMGASGVGGPASTVLMASMREDEEARPGVRLRKGGSSLVQYPDDPARHVGPIDPRITKRGYGESPVHTVNLDCII
ncbi:MAG TPA: zeta toxin family protein, partial [Opitutaceae bacterium]